MIECILQLAAITICVLTLIYLVHRSKDDK